MSSTLNRGVVAKPWSRNRGVVALGRSGLACSLPLAGRGPCPRAQRRFSHELVATPCASRGSLACLSGVFRPLVGKLVDPFGTERVTTVRLLARGCYAASVVRRASHRTAVVGRRFRCHLSVMAEPRFPHRIHDSVGMLFLPHLEPPTPHPHHHL